MVGRAHAPKHEPLLDVTVESLGPAQAIVIDSTELRELVEWHAKRLEEQVENTPTRSPFAALHASYMSDRRSPQEFLDEVEDWRASALESPSSGLHELAAKMTRPFALRIINNATTSLKEVRLDVTFDVPVTALDWEEQGNTVNLFPDRPSGWGDDTYLTGISLRGMGPVVTPDAYDGSIRIASEGPAELVVEVRRLHAEQTVTTPDEDVVLVLFVDKPDSIPGKVTATWRLTAGEVNEVLRGSFDVDVARADWREPLRSVISGIRGDIDLDRGDA